MTLGPGHEERTRRWLLLGLGALAVLLVLQGVIESLYEQRADSSSRRLASDAVASLAQLSKIVHDLDQKTVALARHVFADGSEPAVEASSAELQAELAVLDAKLRRSAQLYGPFTTLPGEAKLWDETRQLLQRFQLGTHEVLALSRRRERALARTRMSALLSDYDDLGHKLVELLRLNRAGAARALDELDALQRRTERLQWAVRIVGLLVLLLFGWWGARRLARYEEVLAAHARDLEGRNRDLDAFAGRVAHDLKNALNPIIISAPLLRRASERPQRILEIADRTERCSLKAAAVIDALLAFSRAGEGVAADEAGALRPVVGAVLEELGPLADRLEVSIEASGLPDVQVRCNPGLLHIVLANLCGNAVKFLDGQAERRVRISARREVPWCRIEVEDTGPGIPERAQRKIFQPFYRVAGTRAAGTGIGLATVRRILDARGGRIQVESSEGHGSRFIVWLPLAEAPEERPPRPENGLRPAAPR